MSLAVRGAASHSGDKPSAGRIAVSNGLSVTGGSANRNSQDSGQAAAQCLLPDRMQHGCTDPSQTLKSWPDQRRRLYPRQDSNLRPLGYEPNRSPNDALRSSPTCWSRPNRCPRLLRASAPLQRSRRVLFPDRSSTPCSADGTSASMRCGPGSCSALLNWSASSWAVVAVLAGTPIPRAMATKFMSGLDRSSSSSAFGPAPAVPTRCSSSRRIAYERLVSTTVVTSNPSRAIVHSAEIVYIALPSDCRHTTG